MRNITLPFTSLLHRCLPLIALPALLCGALAGCGEKEPEAPPKPAAPPKISDADLKKYKPNEAGAVMVLMYHRFEKDEADNDLNRKPDSFRKDLEMLYERGYRPVTALEFVENKMDVPAGKTPVVITFDDALPTQFNIVTGSSGKPSIDRDSAVGILETFSKKHPDWPMKATFFVLPKEGKNSDPFGQAEYVADKFDYLQKKGYEIANHTATHSNMRGMSADKVQMELATAVRDIKEIQADAPMETLALPYGKLPRHDDALKSLQSGASSGTKYQHKAVFLAAWRPNLSPLTRADKKLAQGGTFSIFNPYHLERIKADAREAKLPGTFEYWLKYFDKNPSLRYISDGNLKVATVPVSHKSAVDEARADKQGKILQFYGGSSGSGKGGKGGGSDLSVE